MTTTDDDDARDDAPNERVLDERRLRERLLGALEVLREAAADRALLADVPGDAAVLQALGMATVTKWSKVKPSQYAACCSMTCRASSI